VRFGGREIPHDELTAHAAAIAAALRAAGVAHGDRVAIVLRNEPTFLALSAACGLMGAVPLPVNWHSRGRELAHVLSDSGANVVFAHSDLTAAVEEARPAGAELIEVPVPAEVAVHYGDAPVIGRYPLLGDFIADHEPYGQPARSAPLSMLYTSGTTGLAKGVLREAMEAEFAAGGSGDARGDGSAAGDADADHCADVPRGTERAGSCSPSRSAWS
jgi:long-chain acyl-CoA synthetase